MLPMSGHTSRLGRLICTKRSSPLALTAFRRRSPKNFLSQKSLEGVSEESSGTYISIYPSQKYESTESVVCQTR